VLDPDVWLLRVAKTKKVSCFTSGLLFNYPRSAWRATGRVLHLDHPYVLGNIVPSGTSPYISLSHDR